MRWLLRSKGQSTAEYAIVISLVTATILGVQLYAKRGIQGRIKDAADVLVTDPAHNGIDLGMGAINYSFGTSQQAQYGPADYLESRRVTTTVGVGTYETESTERAAAGDGAVRRESTDIQTRETEERYTY